MIAPSPVYALIIAHLSAIVKGFLKLFEKFFIDGDCWEKITSKLVPLTPCEYSIAQQRDFVKGF